MAHTIVTALLSLWAPSFCLAATITVQQLEGLIASARRDGKSDQELARKVVHERLSERLTGNTLGALSQGAPGRETREALSILADESAFLDPPASEIPETAALSVAEQKSLLLKAANYASAFIRSLPNFICTEVIRRYDDDPTRPSNKADSWKRLRPRDVITGELTFNHGAETSVIKTINGQPYVGGGRGGLTTGGEFGSMLEMIFLGGSNVKVSWGHWETTAGKPLAVFNYVVDRAHSRFQVEFCCGSPGRPGEERPINTVTTPYKGQLFLDVESGMVVRATWQAFNIPADFPTRQSNTLVEYGNIEIAGKSYVCPLKSITLSEIMVPHPSGTYMLLLHSLNEVQFADFRKFEAESHLIANGASPGNPKNSIPARNEPAILNAPIIPPARPKEDTSKSDAPELPASNNPQESGEVQSIPTLLLPPSVSPAPKSIDLPFTTEKQPTFSERVTLVSIRAVVRDRKGQVVGDLTKNDFQIFDNNKRQLISNFSLERAWCDQNQGQQRAGLPSKEPDKTSRKSPENMISSRYVAFLFDDIHLTKDNTFPTVAASDHALNASSSANSLIGVFSTSRRVSLDFTNDREKVRQALREIRPSLRSSTCPNISHYLADRIINARDPQAVELAVAEAVACGIPKPQAPSIVGRAAQESLSEFDIQTRAVVDALNATLRRMTTLAGDQRIIVMVSPGFLAPGRDTEVNSLIERAIESGIIINVIDARGLYVSTAFDVRNRTLKAEVDSSAAQMAQREMLRQQYEGGEQQIQSEVLLQLANGTGGLLFQNNNDLEAGFERLTVTPQVSYLLAFRPENSPSDGKFHKLKVKIAKKKDLAVQARRGYFSSELR